MQRTNATRKQTDKFGPGKHGHKDRVVGPPLERGTVVDADVLDAHQEEISSVIEVAGFTLDATSYTQLLDAIEVHQRAKLAANLTKRTAASSYTGAFAAACYGERFVLVGSAGEIQTSVDGVTWTHVAPDAAFASFMNCAHYGSATYVIAGISGEIQSAATTPTTFAHRTAAGSYAGTFQGSCYDYQSGLHILVGTGGEIQTSPDGTTWTHRTNGGGTVDFSSVASDPDSGVMIAVGNGVAHKSTNGTAWTALSVLPSGATPKITCDAFRGVFVVQTGSYEISESADGGVTWTEYPTTPQTVTARPIVAAEGLLITPLAGLGMYVGKGGAGWAITTSGGVLTPTTDLRCGAFGLGKFVLAGDGGEIFTSLVVS